MIEIFRPINGQYQCVNDPDNENHYVLRAKEGHYPVLVRVEDEKDTPAKEFIERYPVQSFASISRTSISRKAVRKDRTRRGCCAGNGKSSFSPVRLSPCGVRARRHK